MVLKRKNLNCDRETVFGYRSKVLPELKIHVPITDFQLRSHKWITFQLNVMNESADWTVYAMTVMIYSILRSENESEDFAHKIKANIH